MDRREVLKASLASAAGLGISAKREIPPVIGSPAELPSSPVTGGVSIQGPLVDLYDFEAAAKRKLSEPAWEYFNGGPPMRSP